MQTAVWGEGLWASGLFVMGWVGGKKGAPECVLNDEVVWLAVYHSTESYLHGFLMWVI